MAEYKGKISKAPTAEDTEKMDIIIRWAEVKDAIARLEKLLICGGGSVTDAFSYFIEKFYAFFFTTQFYVKEDLKDAAEEMFEEAEKGKINHKKALSIAKRYVWECYKKGMFLEEETVAEELGEEETKEVEM